MEDLHLAGRSNLGYAIEPPERGGVEDAIPIPLCEVPIVSFAVASEPPLLPLGEASHAGTPVRTCSFLSQFRINSPE